MFNTELEIALHALGLGICEGYYDEPDLFDIEDLFEPYDEGLDYDTLTSSIDYESEGGDRFCMAD